jgi:cytosine/adenosine deaminase-related metal-dependent hydrolase
VTVFSADWVLPVEAPPIPDGAVVIEDGRVAAVGTQDELGQGERFERAAIVPGLINAHSHLEYAVYAGFGDGLGFGEWILLHIERKARIGWDDFLAIARLGAAECLRSGVTTVGDASFSGAAAQAAAELGLRAIAYLEVFGPERDQVDGRFREHLARIEHVLSDRVRLGVAPHAPYSAGLELYAACAELELPIATHLAESDAEHRWMTTGSGPWERFADSLPPAPGVTGIRLLAAHGLLSSRMVAAHCVKVDEEELDLLSNHDVAVAHCPRSNAMLGCGSAPLVELVGAGLRVGIGTDSPASTPSFDMFDEIRAAVLLARARARASTAVSASEALELATIGSARALGLDNDIGSLAAGKRADLAVISLDGSPYLPWEDPAAAVVFGGAPERVVLTAVDGEIRYKKGEFEWHELRRRAASARSRMLHAGPAPAAAPSR